MGIINKEIKKVWIGLATVIPTAGNNELDGAKGACVNVIYLAKSQDDFKEKIIPILLEYGYYLESLEDIEPFNFELSYTDNLKKLAKTVLKTKSLRWGAFYTFD